MLAISFTIFDSSKMMAICMQGRSHMSFHAMVECMNSKDGSGVQPPYADKSYIHVYACMVKSTHS